MKRTKPTVFACSGGLPFGTRTKYSRGGLMSYALKMATDREQIRLCFIDTACGDNPSHIAGVYELFAGSEVQASHLSLFPMPNLPDVRAHLLNQDVIWVGGGSVSGLLSMWRLHGVDEVLRECWEDGVVLAGDSAGSICWHVGGTTDSFGPELRPMYDGLGFLPYSNGVHFDSEAGRRSLLHQLIADERLPDGYATDEGVGLCYCGTELVEVVAETDRGRAYYIERTQGGQIRETVIGIGRVAR